MILLALFDSAFGKKNKLRITNEMTEQHTGIMESIESDKPKPDAEVANSKPKPQAISSIETWGRLTTSGDGQ